MSKRSGQNPRNPSLLNLKSPKKLQRNPIVFDKRYVGSRRNCFTRQGALLVRSWLQKKTTIGYGDFRCGCALSYGCRSFCHRLWTPISRFDGISSSPENNVTVTGVVLRADPNPVPGGTEMGKTTITWQTGSEAVADIYYASNGCARIT